MAKKGFFISHASEDKNTFVKDFAKKLKDAGIEIWYDEFSLKWGDSLQEKINQGLANCKYGIVVLSENFFKKNWTKQELDALFARQTSEGKSVILPIVHGLEHNRLVELNPILAGKLYKKSTDDINDLIETLKQMAQD